MLKPTIPTTVGSGLLESFPSTLSLKESASCKSSHWNIGTKNPQINNHKQYTCLPLLMMGAGNLVSEKILYLISDIQVFQYVVREKKKKKR